MFVQVYYFLASKHLLKNKVKDNHAISRGVLQRFMDSFFPQMGSIILVNQLGTLSKFPEIVVLLPYFKMDWETIRWVTE